MPEFLVISSFPDAEKARQIGTALIEKQLAACVNLIPSVESIYRWQGKVESATEVMAFIKTTGGCYAQLEAMINELHPYDVPEIIAVELKRGSRDYLRWIRESSRGEFID